MSEKRISILFYCNENRDFETIKKSLDSIENQNINPYFYDVVILNDNCADIVVNEINDYIQKNEFSNYYIVSFAEKTGLPVALEFALKNKLVKSKYFTVLKGGDTYEPNWLQNFTEKLYPTNYDVYL